MSSLIRSITLKNFKGFSEEVQINLRPITLLFGPNSAGKSSVLQAMQYVNEVLSGGNLDADSTRHGGEVLGLGGFQNIVHGRDLSSSIEVGVRMSLGDVSMLDDEEEDISDFEQPSDELLKFANRLNAFKRNANDVEIRLTIGWSLLRNEPIVQAYEVSFNNEWCARVIASADGRQSSMKLNGSHSLFMVPNSDPGNHITELAGLVEAEDVVLATPFSDGEDQDVSQRLVSWLPDVIFDLQEHGAEPAGAGFSNWMRMMDGARPKFNAIRIRAPGAKDAESLKLVASFEAFLNWLLLGPYETLRTQLSRLRYLGPLRVVPARDIALPRRAISSDWADGSAAWATLANGSSSLRARVSSWMSDSERLNTGYAVSVRKTREYEIDANDSKRLSPVGQVRTRLALVDRFGLQHDPQDVGIGISQILPVVVAASDGRASLVCIEQPELHVHPAVQVGLGDLFIDGAVNQRLSFLVETHSEHLVMRLQRRLREQISGEIVPGTVPIDPKDVCFIYLGRNESGHVEATQIGLTEDGKFDASWPNGFFIERSTEMLPSAMRAKLHAQLVREEKK